MLTVAMNLNNLAVSQYSNFDFNSFCELGGKFYGANENGIFELDSSEERDRSSSTTTTAVVASVKIGPTDLGILAYKRLRKCNISLECTGVIKMTATADEESGGGVEVHQFPGAPDGREHVIAITYGRDVSGRYFTFLLENVNGANFKINKIEAFIEILTIKPKREGAS